MTREEMIKKSFKPYMLLNVDTAYGVIEMMLIATNFDNECFLMRIIDVDKFDEEDIWISISKISFPRKKMEILK